MKLKHVITAGVVIGMLITTPCNAQTPIDYVYTTERVNIRKCPSINSEIILTVDRNTELERTGIDVTDGWDMIVIDDNNYYISNKYITNVEPCDEISDSDLRYMSAIIFAEAGNQCQAGQQAVGIIVMNRKESESFANTIYDVINEPYQFSPVRNGSFAKALSLYDNGKIPEEIIESAKYAMNGNKSVDYNDEHINLEGFLFFSRWVKNARVKIQDHMFK